MSQLCIIFKVKNELYSVEKSIYNYIRLHYYIKINYLAWSIFFSKVSTITQIIQIIFLLYTHTLTHTRACFDALRRFRASLNIEYSNYWLSISFPTGLPTISTCHCTRDPSLCISTLVRRWFFSETKLFPAPRVFTRCIRFCGQTKRFQFCSGLQSRYSPRLLLYESTTDLFAWTGSVWQHAGQNT